MKVDVILAGFPGRTNRGVLGFCNVTLVQAEKNILFDTGHFADRSLLISELRKRGLKPRDVDIVILSHLHYDHCLSIDLFKKAEVVISSEELKYASSSKPQKLGDFYIPRHVVDMLKGREVIEAEEGTEIEEDVYLLETPGHTPGSISLVVEERNGRTVIAGDAAKNAWEFKHNRLETFYGEEADAVRSIKKLKKVADLVIPGHDRCFLYDKKKGEISFLSDLDLRVFVRVSPDVNHWTTFSISTASLSSSAADP